MDEPVFNDVFEGETARALRDSLEGFFVDHLGTTLEVRERDDVPEGTSTVVGTVRIEGAGEGQVRLGCELEVAGRIARAMVGLDEIPEGMLADVFGEVANVIVGRAKSALERSGLRITPPEVVLDGSAPTIDAGLRLHCDTGLGPMDVELEVRVAA